MVGILEIIWGILQYWHTVEFRRLRNSIVAGIIFPFIFLLLAAVAGGWSWSAKLILIEIELFGAAICLIWLAYRRTPLALEIATAIRIAQDPSLRNPIDAAYDYLRLVAAVIASELATGLLILWLPVHRNYPMSFLALATVMIFITYAIWRKGKFWWPKLVYRLAFFTLVAALFSILFPQTSVVISRLGGGVDEKIAGKLECVENPNLPQCQKPASTPSAAPAPTAAISVCYDAQDMVVRGEGGIIAMPGCWSGNISIPPQSWFRIVPKGRVTIRSWSGRIIHDGPGQDNWLGDEIRDGNFRIISDESQPVKVVIITRPK